METLPQDVVAACFVHLDPTSFRSAALTCRAFASAASDDRIAEAVCRNYNRSKSKDPAEYDGYTDGERRVHRRDYALGTFEGAFDDSYFELKTRILDEDFQDAEELKVYSLRVLPREIGVLTSLQSLDVTECRLTELPAELGLMTSLEHLDVQGSLDGGNRLVELPGTIGDLERLEELVASDNLLTKLPRDIGRLSALQTLVLNGNRIDELPREIGLLIFLERLELNGNGLTELPDEIGGLVRLRVLCLIGNRLVGLPSTIGGMKSLNYLDVTDNRLVSVPPEISRLSLLEFLFLNGNHIVGLPADVFRLDRLQCLHANGRRLTVPLRASELDFRPRRATLEPEKPRKRSFVRRLTDAVRKLAACRKTRMRKKIKRDMI